MLIDKIRVELATSADTPEDVFSAALATIFTDDTRTQHGDPGATVVYKSARFGDIRLSLANPERDDERKLFAHYLWNAGVWLASAIGEEGGTEIGDGVWEVEGETVLELGAGLGLGGIVSCLAGAEKVVLSDYPAPDILANLACNVRDNIPSHLASRITIQGHEWGVLNDAFALSHRSCYTRVLAADCLWMPWQHRNLARSMSHFLAPDPSARIFVVAGFHTGRAKMAPFFDVAVDEGLETESITEVDVDGHSRPWLAERDGAREDITGRKRWLVVAKLKRRIP